jgi:hypothetical protein
VIRLAGCRRAKVDCPSGPLQMRAIRIYNRISSNPLGPSP